MAKLPVIQTAFNRGELDPALFGRTDWQSYFSGAKTMRNMVCRTQGGALKRGGTEFVVKSLDQSKPSVLIRFRFAVEQTYMLEFADRRFRVLKDGGVVLYPKGHAKAGQEVIIDSPYSAEQIRRVRTAQKEDTMIFTHPDHRPRTLTRKDHHIWEFDFLTFGATVKPPTGVSFDVSGGNYTKYVVSSKTASGDESLPSDVLTCSEKPSGWADAPNVISWDYTTCRNWLYANQSQTDPGVDPYIQGGMNVMAYMGYRWDIGSGAGGDPIFLVYRPGAVNFSITLSINPYEWLLEALYGISLGYKGILQDARQRVLNVVTERNNQLMWGKSVLSWNATAGAARYRVYRAVNTEQGERYYLIGETTQTTFADNSLAFVNQETPQKSNRIFEDTDDYPGVCTFFEQRLVLARTNRQPNTVWGSRVGAHTNFNKNDTGEGGTGLIADTSAWEFTLNADESNEILWAKSMDDILFGTAGGEFRMSGGGYIITPTNVNAKRQSNYGCSPITPIVVGQAVVGVGHKGRVLRAYQFNYTDDAYKGSSISHYAGHLFHRRQIVSIAYQYEPESILWVVMSDGALLSCTYMNEEEVLGWSRHDTDGRFETVATMVSEDGEDEIWVQVARDVNGRTIRTIERFKQPQHEDDDIADAWCVDCGLAREGDPADELSGLDHLEGKQVACLGDGSVYENLTVANGRIKLPVKVRKAIVGLPYTAELETMELEPLGGGSIAANAKRPITVSVLFYHSRECFYGHPDNPNVLKFRTSERHDEPIRPRTIRKNLSYPAPPDGSGASVRLWSSAPVPFGVLSVAVEMRLGDTAPNPGRTHSA